MNVEQFMRLIGVKLNCCWIWPLAKDNLGYGAVYIGKTRWKVHRLAYTIEYGTIPDGLFVCHKCNNPSCCNPEHLYLATNSQNLKDAARDGLTAHQWKFSKADCEEMRRLHSSGTSLRSIGRMFRTNHKTVGSIVRDLNRPTKEDRQWSSR